MVKRRIMNGKRNGTSLNWYEKNKKRLNDIKNTYTGHKMWYDVAKTEKFQGIRIERHKVPRANKNIYYEL